VARLQALPRTDSYEVSRQWPDKILSTPCAPCEFDTKKKLRRLADHCRRLAYIIRTDPSSAGMSAPQIGVPLRIVAFRDPNGAIYALCNPEIVEASEETNVEFEGCFSLPQRWFRVERHNEIAVRYFDMTGELGELRADGYAARILQHEMDHLDGKMIIDRRVSDEEFTHEQVLEMMDERDRKDGANAKR
jgi:peptide deformylase